MGTIVTMEIVNDESRDAAEGLDRAFDWFRHVEATCSRFDPTSDVRQLVSHVGEPVAVSDTLFEVVSFALVVAAASDGAFDPTVGLVMEQSGFTRHYRSGETAPSGVAAGDAVTYRDVVLDAEARTITLTRPLVIDLGGVAKGLAIDLAARELRPFKNFSVYAGGDLYLGGHNAHGGPWSVGIRHPRAEDALMETLCVSDGAVCTSGDYERRQPDADGHHIIDPATGTSTNGVASVTVTAPTAMLADALATAAFVMASRAPGDPVTRCTSAVQWLEAQGVQGVIVTSTLERHATKGFGRDD